MRIEIAGAQITDAVVETLETLQNDRDVAQLYIDTLDRLTRSVILDLSDDDTEDFSTLSRLRALQMMRRDIVALAMPPDVDDPDNDTPTATL